jgi:hypothetical protein
MSYLLMRKTALFVLVFFAAIHAYAQDTTFHYIKFLHVGERIMPGDVPLDSAELLNDTIPSVSIITDRQSYQTLRTFMKYSDYHLVRNPGMLEFGTLKMISDNNWYFIPGSSVSPYFKKMVKYLKKNKADPQLIQAIIDNYPWVFNP